MNSYFYILLGFFTISSAFGQEVSSLRSLALDKATQELHAQLIKPQSFKKRLALIKSWDAKSGLVLPKQDNTKDTILDNFEQKYFSKLEYFKQVPYGQIYAITNDSNIVITDKIYTHNDKNGLSLWDLLSNKRICTFTPPHTGIINHVALNADETKAISASADHTLILWDLKTGTPIHTLKGHENNVLGVNFTGDYEKALSSSADGRLILWDLKTGKPFKTFQGHTDWVVDCVISADDSKVISTDKKTIILWDLKTGNMLQKIKSKNSFSIFEHKNLFATENKLFKLEDWHSIIMNMPRESKTIIQTPTNLLNVNTTGSLTGLYKTRLLNKKLHFH